MTDPSNGRAPAVANPDVLVVGGGPAGLAAAVELRRVGLSVVVAEREDGFGGIARHSDHPGYGVRDLHRPLRGPAYAAWWTARAAACGVDLRPGTTVTVEPQDRVVHAAQGATSETPPRFRLASVGRVDHFAPSAVIVATGCRERPRSARLVPGDRPSGVLTTGSLQRLVAARLPVGHRAVIVGADYVSFSAALALRHAGVEVVAMVTNAPAPALRRGLARTVRRVAPFPLHTSSEVTLISGRDRVERIETEDDAGRSRCFVADTVVFTGSWVPENELARSLELAISPASFHGPTADALGRTSRYGVFVAGNLRHGAFAADRCALEGAKVARAVSDWVRRPTRDWPALRPEILPGDGVSWVDPATGFYAAETYGERRPVLHSPSGVVAWTGRRIRHFPGLPNRLPTAQRASLLTGHGTVLSLR